MTHKAPGADITTEEGLIEALQDFEKNLYIDLAQEHFERAVRRWLKSREEMR